jgi:hypothetical protein
MKRTGIDLVTRKHFNAYENTRMIGIFNMLEEEALVASSLPTEIYNLILNNHTALKKKYLLADADPYVVFVLGFDNDIIRGWWPIVENLACDEAYDHCQAVAKEFQNSSYNNCEMPLYEALQEFLVSRIEEGGELYEVET